MSADALPEIYRSELDDSQTPDVYIYHLIAKYHELLASDTTGHLQEHFTAEQNILLAFNVLDTQVSSGGFIQLIENGYGSYIFDTPLSHYLQDWGAVKIATIIEQAALIYRSKKDILEREKTLEEFAKLYQEHTDFEIPEQEFYQVINSEREIIVAYIRAHISHFAKLV
jgi:tRNA/tmRNA/rRNA uracil-C5-methylase (TrmA/RlmC/RlmD family)